MATSSKRSDYVYGELISPLERFSWTEDEVVTERRRRREKTSRILVWLGVAFTVAGIGVLYEARIIAFGPLATAASGASTGTRLKQREKGQAIAKPRSKLHGQSPDHRPHNHNIVLAVIRRHCARRLSAAMASAYVIFEAQPRGAMPGDPLPSSLIAAQTPFGSQSKS
jgi:hypothetical protein